MKKLTQALIGCCVLGLLFSCATTGEASSSSVDFTPASTVKRPEMIDHKNLQWGNPPPEWVMKDRSEIEAMPQYKDVRIFKFEDVKVKDLEGGLLWAKNFTAMSEIAREIQTRVRDAAAAAAVGNKEQLEGYMEQVVTSLSEATINGLKKESEYWMLRRYFKADGDIEGDFYTISILYSIPRNIIEELIQRAIDGVAKPKTDEEVKARNLVNQAMINNF
ncbi:MAG: hypothetical protein ACTTH7_04570 [Treponema sp.]